jgi:hypothetical protein
MFYGHLACFMVIWHVLWSFGMFYGHLACFMDIWHVLHMFIWYVYIMDIWNSLWPLGVFYWFWYIVRKKNSGSPGLATRVALFSAAKHLGGNQTDRFFFACHRFSSDDEWPDTVLPDFS